MSAERKIELLLEEFISDEKELVRLSRLTPVELVSELADTRKKLRQTQEKFTNKKSLEKQLKLLNKMYDCAQDNETIDTKVFYRVGEHIIFDGKKYSIFSISINAKNIDKEKGYELKALGEKYNFYVEVSKGMTINIPMITA